jgi:hypothetical protein
MLTACPSNDLSQVLFWGHQDDHKAVLELVWKCDDAPGVPEVYRDFHFGIGGEFRKASEGRRLVGRSLLNPEAKIFGASLNWVHACFFKHMLQMTVSTAPASARDHAVVYAVRASFEEAVSDAFGGNAAEILRIDAALSFHDDDRMPPAIQAAAEEFEDLNTPARRAKGLAPLLKRINPIAVAMSHA